MDPSDYDKLLEKQTCFYAKTMTAERKKELKEKFIVATGGDVAKAEADAAAAKPADEAAAKPEEEAA